MTATITGGTVRIEETRQIADYQPRKVVVELHFSAESGRDAEAMLDHVSDLATRKVQELLSGKPAAPVRTKADIEKEAVEKLGGPVTTDVTPARKPPGRPPKAVPKPPADDLGDIPQETKTPPKPSADDLSDLGVEAAEEITDAILLSKITAHVQKVKNAPAIRQLIAKQFPGDAVGKQARDIPQDKRTAFLEELAKIAAP